MSDEPVDDGDGDGDGDGEPAPDDNAMRGTESAADPQRMQRQRRNARREEDEAAVFWRRIFEDPVGRREMWGILAAAGTFDAQFGQGGGLPHPQFSWWLQGKKDFGQALYHKWLSRAPEAVTRMVIEHHPGLAMAPRRPTRPTG